MALISPRYQWDQTERNEFSQMSPLERDKPSSNFSKSAIKVNIIEDLNQKISRQSPCNEMKTLEGCSSSSTSSEMRCWWTASGNNTKQMCVQLTSYSSVSFLTWNPSCILHLYAASGPCKMHKSAFSKVMCLARSSHTLNVWKWLVLDNGPPAGEEREMGIFYSIQSERWRSLHVAFSGSVLRVKCQWFE